MKKLSKRDLRSFLKKYPEWNTNAKETELSRRVTFSEYIDGLIIIARVAVHAEILKHHPDITFSHGKLKIKVTTHATKSLTKVDLALATRIENVLTD